METSWDSTKARLRSHVFRIWTACAVLAGYVYSGLYAPEMLTWWKRTTTSLIEAGCSLLPYPWGDRIEATLGNFGLWVQITLAIIVFRILVWLVIIAVRRVAVRKPLVPEMAHPGEYHRNPGGIGRGDHLGIADRSAGLDNGRGTGRDGGFQPVREREEGV